MTGFIKQLQNMAALTTGYILVRSPDATIYTEADAILIKRASEDHVSVEGDEKAISRMAALANLLEHQSDFDSDEDYCVVVTDWTERAEDIAQYVADTVGPIIPMLLTPARANAAFSGQPIFGAHAVLAAAVPTLGELDGSHRTSAALVGLHDRKRVRRRFHGEGGS